MVRNTYDLSERKRAEQALRRSENYLAEAQRLTHTGSCAIDGTSRETVLLVRGNVPTFQF